MRVKTNVLVEGSCEAGTYSILPGVFYEVPDSILAEVLMQSPGHSSQSGEPLGVIEEVVFTLPEPEVKLTKKQQAALDAATAPDA